MESPTVGMMAFMRLRRSNLVPLYRRLAQAAFLASLLFGVNINLEGAHSAGVTVVWQRRLKKTT
jgi:hypothetical protein